MRLNDAIQAAIQADIPVILWGAPGTGKTAAIQEAAGAMGAHLETLIGSQLDPTDVGGRPVVTENGELRQAAPPWAMRIKQALDAGKQAWVFMDELSCAPPSVQASLLRVVAERCSADIDLSGCRMLAAANPGDQAADGGELALAMANRWAHFNWALDSEMFSAGLLGGWGNPDSSTHQARAAVATYISRDASALLVPPPAMSENIRGWASPRSWTRLASALAALGDSKTWLSKSGRELSVALVGISASASFSAWLSENNLPDPKEILDRKVSLPERGDLRMATLDSACAYALAFSRISDFWGLLMEGRKDLRVASARRALAAVEASGITMESTPELVELAALQRTLS